MSARKDRRGRGGEKMRNTRSLNFMVNRGPSPAQKEHILERITQGRCGLADRVKSEINEGRKGSKQGKKESHTRARSMNEWMNDIWKTERHLRWKVVQYHSHCENGGKERSVRRRSVRTLQLYLIAGMKNTTRERKGVKLDQRPRHNCCPFGCWSAHLKDESERTDILLLANVLQWPLGHSEKWCQLIECGVAIAWHRMGRDRRMSIFGQACISAWAMFGCGPCGGEGGG